MCAKATAAATGFSISGLLDSQAKTRERYPVTEIDVSAIADHPNNALYSMDADAIEKLAVSIREHGLTDLPLVRKLPDGGWQMLSGHRRRAAYALLAQTDETFATMPCRVVENLDDAQALLLLHSANFFTRQLSAAEFAGASKALGVEVERRRSVDPALKGKRTEDIKAAIIEEQSGQRVSGKTVQRKEALATKIETKLATPWQAEASKDALSEPAINALTSLPKSVQADIYAACPAGLFKRQRTAFIAEQVAAHSSSAPTAPDARLQKAVHLLQKCADSGITGDKAANSALVASAALYAQKLAKEV